LDHQGVQTFKQQIIAAARIDAKLNNKLMGITQGQHYMAVIGTFYE
jgi:hypothetical protein